MNHRGSNLADGKVTIDEGTDWSGTRCQLHFEGDQLVVQHTYDADPIIDYVRARREGLDQSGWKRDINFVGTIPMLDYMRLIAPIKGRKKRDAAMLAYFKERTKFVAFDRYLKG
jgi:hypothetical protein